MRQLCQTIQTIKKLSKPLTAMLLVAGFTVFFTALQAESVYARTKVQSGYTAAIIGTNSYTTSIEEVDLDKSWILFDFRTMDSPNGNAGGGATHCWGARFTDSSNIEIQRDAASLTTSNYAHHLSYYVIESDAYQVEWVNVSFGLNELTRTIDLSNRTPSGAMVDFTAGKAFSVVRGTNFANTSTNAYNGYYFTSEILYDTGAYDSGLGKNHDQLVLTRQAAETAPTSACDVWGWVIQHHDDSTVYYTPGGFTYPTNIRNHYEDIMNTTPAIAAVDRSKAWLYFAMDTNTSALACEIRGALSSTSQMGYNSSATYTYNRHIFFYVVEQGTLGKVDSGTRLAKIGSKTDTHTFSETFDPNRSFCRSTQDSTGTGTAIYRIRHTTQIINGGTQMQVARGESGQEALFDFFAIELEPMILFTPNGGETLYSNAAYNITWYAPSQLTDMEILLSNDSGATYPVTLFASTPNDGSETVTWPSGANTSGTNMRVKIRDVNWDELGRSDDTYSSDESDADFTIIPKIVVSYPNGGESIGYEDPVTMTWNYYGDDTSKTVRIDYDTISGTGGYPNNIATGLSATSSGTQGSHALVWASTPFPLSTTLRIRVRDEADSSVEDESNNNFTVQGDLTLTSPVGTEQWKIGESRDITWTGKGESFMTNGINILISRNSGGVYDVPIATNYLGGSPYSWTVVQPSSDQARIKIQSADFPAVSDTSAADFELLAVITVETPNQFSPVIVWRAGQTRTIEWTTNPAVSVPLVDIEYDPGAGYVSVVGAETNTDSYNWSIPAGVTLTKTGRIRVSDNSDNTLNDESDYDFYMLANITVTSPAGSETVSVGAAKTISFDVVGNTTGNYDVKLKTSGGYDTTLGTKSVTGPGTYTLQWTPSGAQMYTGAQIKVGLQGDDDPTTGYAGESGVFNIGPRLTLDYPTTSGLSFQVGDEVYIRWTPNPTDFGGGGTVDIKYDTASGTGGYGNTIITGLASDNIPGGEAQIGYKWTIPEVPGIVGENVRIKVFQTGKEASVYSTSQFDFSIFGTLALTGESDGQGSPVWKCGQSKSITWNAVGDIGLVDILYAKDGTNFLNTVVSGVNAAAETYLWNPIPNNVIDTDRNTAVKLRIISQDYPSISGDSTLPITFEAQIVMGQPNGTETLYVDTDGVGGTTYNITWTTYGQVPNVILSYDTAGAGTYLNTIAGGAPMSNVEAYAWDVPNAIGNQVRVKVMSANSGTYVYATSAQNFTIKGQIVVTSPDASDVGANAWLVDGTGDLDQSYLIEWTNYGDLGTVNVYYSDNGGAQYLSVSAGEDGANGPQSLSWQIPATWGGRNVIGTDNYIKVADADDESNVFDESAAFEIKGQIELESPLTGGTYEIGGTDIDINWNYAGNLGNIDIFFSSNGGSTWGAAVDTISVAYVQPYQLAVPAVTTTTGKIKLEQVSDRTNVTSQTGDPGFRIKSNFIDIYPDNEAPVLEVGDLLTITWDYTGTIANVAIDYDKTSGGGGYTGSVIASTGAAAKSYGWTIPTTNAAVSNNVRIRVRDALDATVSIESSADFMIKPIITLLTPAGGESWVIGGPQQAVTWSTQGFTAGQQVVIDFSSDGGSTWPASGNYIVNSGIVFSAGTYNWTIPDIITTQGQMRIYKALDPTVVDDDNPWFTIKGRLDITDPDGSVNLPIGGSYTIRWDVEGSVGNVALSYSTDAPHAVWTPIAGAGNLASSLGEGAGFNWTPIPDAPSATVKVRVAPAGADPTDANDSNANNAIIGTITVVHPMNAETMVVGQPYGIEYSKTGSITNFKIEYNTGSGWNPIVANTTDFPTYTWLSVDDNISNTVQVRVSDATNANVYGLSTADNIIKGSINLILPNGAETLTVGTPYNITWTETGSTGDILIEYSNNNFSTASTINAAYTGVSPYPWTPLPGDITNAPTMKVRLTTIGGIPVTDQSAGGFTIVGQISNVRTANAVWLYGQTQNVLWDQNGNIPSVDIYYKTSAAASYVSALVTNDTGHTHGSNQSYTATVPDENSEDCWIRVQDNANASVQSATASAFSIRPNITVSSPAGGANLSVGSGKPYTVDWSLNGASSVGSVNVAYSTVGAAGPFSNTIIASTSASSGTTNWSTVNDTISSNCYVRVMDTVNNNAYGLSGAGTTPFNIIGSITVQAPNGNENWAVGDTGRNITWTKSGTIGNVIIEVDYDNDGSYDETLTTIDAESFSLYNWNPIPDQVTNDAVIRITDADNPAVYDESNAPFHIIGKFVFVQPDGSTLISGEPQSIDWTPTGSAISQVKLEFYNGTGWSDIVAATPNSGNYASWTVPSTTAALNCRVRITAANPVQPATATSSSNFWVHGKIDINLPNSSSSWTVGNTPTIDFDITGKIDNVNIALSKTGGIPYTYSIVNNLPVVSGNNTYNAWTVPSNADILTADQARIKITDSAFATVYTESDTFEIKGSVAVLTPSASGITMQYGGLPYAITWSASQYVTAVSIFYSDNNGATYDYEITNPLTGVPALPASYNWTIPNRIVGNQMYIRVEDFNNSNSFDVSDNPFEIIGSLALDAPIGGEDWAIGSTQTISWTPTGTFTNVRIRASIDDFSTTILDVTRPAGATGVQQNYSWVNLPDALSNNVKVRISDAGTSSTAAVTSPAFTIEGILDLTVPEAGQVWRVGETTRTITWDATGTITNVKLEYKTSAGGLYTTIVADSGSHTAGPGQSYTWASGVADVNSEDCYIRVSDVNNSNVASVSAAAFSIRPRITVSSPAGGARLEVGSGKPYTVDWSLNGSTKVTVVDVAYSTSGASGPFSQTIQAGVDATSETSVNWSTVNDTISNNCYVRVIDTGNNNVYGLSGSGTTPFSIVGAINLTAPTGGEDWAVTDMGHQITWNKTGTIGNVEIHVDYGLGGGYQLLTTQNAEAVSLWAWEPIPDNVTNNARIRVRDADDTQTYAESGVFAIAAKFSVTEPTDLDEMIVGDGFNILWSRSGSAVSQVKIEYSSNGGTNWTTISDTIPNNGSYSWSVADAITTSGKIRISDPNNADANAVSGGNFIIKGKITVSRPNSGLESWDVGTAENIEWAVQGSIPTVNIQYSHNGGTNWTNLNIAPVAANSSPWSWNIVDGTLLTQNGVIRVVDTSDPTVNDVSDLPFEIKGSVELTAPINAGIIMSVRDNYAISWTKFGITGNIELHYSTDGGIAGGGSYPGANLIGLFTADASPQIWSVPDDISTNCRVRVRAENNTNVWDESDNVFSIQGGVTLNAPLGGEDVSVGDGLSIQWTPEGTFPQVKIEYSTDDFTTPISITTTAAGADAVLQSFGPWTVPPAAMSGNFKIRVAHSTIPAINAVSGAINVKGVVHLTSPVGGETFVHSSQRNITWYTDGAIAAVDIGLSTTGPAGPFTNIFTGTANDGTELWTVSGTLSTNCYIRVSDANESTVYDQSAAPFTLKGNLRVDLPNAGTEVWVSGDPATINWTRFGAVSTIDIDLSLNSGSTYSIPIASGVDASLGTYEWPAVGPNLSSGLSAKVRVQDSLDNTINDVSNNNFKVVGKVTLLEPVGGETYEIADGTTEIRWSTVGNIANVRIQYSANNGSSWSTVTASTAAGAGSYAYPYQNPPTTQGLVRIFDATDATVTDQSASNFKVQAVFDVTSPESGEVWKVGTQYPITWDNVRGTAPNVTVSYSTNGDLGPWTAIQTGVANIGTINWVVADAASTSCKIKVADANDPTASDVSAATFQIKADLALDQPNGGTLYVGNSYNINWSVSGTISTVTIEYSTDGGLTVAGTIATNYNASLETFPWTVVDAIGNDVKVIITNDDDISTKVMSSSSFEIKGRITDLVPNGGNTLEVGIPFNITWTSHGSLGNVLIEYSTDGGLTYNPTPIAANEPTANGADSFSWNVNVPGALGSQTRIRISDTSDSTVQAVSAANFTIKGRLRLDYPVGGEIMRVGIPENIAWTRFGNIPAVKIEYSTDSGGSYLPANVIVASTDAAVSPYAWAVDDAIGNQVRIRISDTGDSSVNDESPDFTIKGRLQLTTPNGGQTWLVGATQRIEWLTFGTISNVNLGYSRDGGSTYTPIVSGLANINYYDWTVADAIDNDIRIRVRNTADTSVEDASDANFTIRGYLEITAPNGGVDVEALSPYNITWIARGTMSQVTLKYSNDGGATYGTTITTTANAATQSYSWNTPDVINACRVQISSNDDPTNVVDISDANFRIIPEISIISPVGGETWQARTTEDILWSTKGTISNVRIQLSTDGGATYPTSIVASTAAAAGTFPWNLLDDISGQCRVRIASTIDSTINAVSPANFTILPRFDVTYPDGGEVLVVGASETITWDTWGNSTTVRIDFSTNGVGGPFDKVITAATANNDSFPWTVNDAISSSVRLRVSDYNLSAASSMSNANFKIRGNIVVDAPDGGERWIAGTSQDITWTITGTIPNVKIDYSDDNGGSWNTVSGGASWDSSTDYPWTIPQDLSLQALVRVSDALDPTVYDESDAVFKISGNLTLIAPNGPETWIVDDIENITWLRTGLIQNVSLEYSTNSGSTYTSITASTDASSGSYPWQVADAISNQVRVRVADTTDPTVVRDASDANFRIKGSLDLLTPDGGEAWEVGTTQAITWSVAGSIAAVKLDYSNNSGATYNFPIIASTSAAAETYNWTIPDNIAGTIRVKITSVADSTVTDVSAADFSIIGRVNLLSPDGGEVWPVGSSQAISWQKFGNWTTVKIEYSTNGGVTYPYELTNPVTGYNAALGSFPWTVPDTISLNCKVKVSDFDNPTTVNDESTAVFKIRGDLTLTYPVGGEILLINDNPDITWTRFGSIANAKLDYSTDGGLTYTDSIVGSVDASLQTFSWTVPDDPSILCRVKISDAADPTVFDVSGGNFTIRGGFEIITPNGGERWEVDSTKNITWTTFGTITNVNLSYSRNNGSNWTLITSNYANIGSYTWTVADGISNQCLIRVVDFGDIDAYDISDAVFTIHGAVTLTAPNGGEDWPINSTNNITWTHVGSFASVRLEYSTNGGSTYDTVITTGTPAALDTYQWTIPLATVISNTVKVKITDTNDANVWDESNAVFKIRGDFTIIAPNGGEAITVGTTQPITWSTSGTIANVKLEYSINAGTTWTVIQSSTANTGTYNWTVPDAISEQCRVKVSDISDASAFDTSNNNFKIQGNLRITAPNGGETWAVGQPQLITWARTGSIASIRLEYSNDGGTIYTVIGNGLPNSGSYSWTLPDAITTNALVRITNVDDPTITDISDATFKIQGSFTVTSPNGGEAWLVGSSQTITWNSFGTMAFVRLEYSTDGGTSYTEIVNSTGNTGNYTWTVPDAVSGNCRIRVSDVNDIDAKDTSNANFRIRASYTVTSPSLGTEQFLVGRNHTITWTDIGTVPNVRLQYSRDDFLTDIQTIDAAAPNTRSYTWTVPDAISNNVKVRVSDPNDAGAYDDSNNYFRITGSFTVTSPNGGEMWDVNSAHDLTWTWSGTMAQVRLEYSTNGGGSYPNIITATDNDGVYEWTVPDDITAQFRIRVSDLADSTAFDTSNANAKIRADFELTDPDGGEILYVAETFDITWTTVGTVANVKLAYSTNDFTTSSPITGSTVNDGSFTWTLPDAISTTLKVRVTSLTDDDAYSISDANFEIKGKLRITAPNGAEQWDIGANYAVTWVTTGTIPNVNLYYSSNSGSTFPNTIATNLGNIGTYTWTVPDDATGNARIRVQNSADSAVYDDSDANFGIVGNFTVTSPNGGENWIVNDVHNITWNWGGTIPNVTLRYSTDGGTTYANTIATVANGLGGGGSHSYAWTIPDNISQTVRVKVEDANDPLVFDISDADLAINGNLILNTPNGGERWVTREDHTISWTTNGTIPTVDLVYSKDGFATDIQTIVSDLANTNSYNWKIPDDRSDTVTLRVRDPRDPTATYDDSNGTFRIDYYTVTFIIRDLVTNEPLSALTVDASSDEGDTWQTSFMPNNPAAPLGSPVEVDLPYGFWTAVWLKTSFGDKQFSFQCEQDAVLETIYMETTVIHIWRAYSEYTYEANNDVLKVSSWLERDGFAVTGAVDVTLTIYDDTGALVHTLYSNTPNAAGFFNLRWDAPTGLEDGKVYTTVAEIQNASGAIFRTPSSFAITESKQLQQTQQAMEQMTNVTLPNFQNTMENTIQQGLEDQETLIDTKMTEQANIIDTKTTQMQQKVDETMTSFETRSQTAIDQLQEGADQATAAGQELETIAKRQSGELILPTTVLTGGTVNIRFRIASGLQPLMDVISYDGNMIRTQQPLIESTTVAGLYGYDLYIDGTQFDPGKAFTVVVTESSTGNLQAGSVMVESTSLTSVEGLASSIPQVKSIADQTLEAVSALQSTLATGGDVGQALTNLQDAVDELPALLASEGPSAKMAEDINALTERLTALAGEEGFDISGMVEEALSNSPTMKEIKQRTENIKSIVGFLQQLFEHKFGGMEDEPMVSTSLSTGSLVVNVVAANPSTKLSQTTQVKVYLPKEVTPNDIIDSGGLSVEFDATKSIYYVYKDNIQLAPKEILVFKVEIEDIWLIPQTSFDVLKLRATKLASALEKTEYADDVTELSEKVYAAVDDMVAKQNDITLSREQHIGAYRANVLMMDKLKAELTDMEKLMVTNPDETGSLTRAMTWKIIITVILFIGLLAAVFFFTWYRKSGLMQDTLDKAKQFSFPEEGKSEDKENKS